MSETMQERPFKGKNDPLIFSEIRGFLNALNSGRGKPLETLSPADARQVLVGAQKSVEVNYSGMIHDYGLLNPIAQVPAVQTALLQAAAYIKNFLQ